jgi:23S rRNA (guanosine2251-2'-O)-methyltransferase
MLVSQKIEDSGHLQDIFKLAAQRKVPVTYVPRQQLDPLGENHQGVAMEVGDYPYSDLSIIQARARDNSEPLFVLILDLIQNPQNLGTLIRTADAVGVHGILLPLARAASVTPAVVQASSGASEHLLIAQVNLVQSMVALKEQNVWIAGLEGSPEARPLEQVRLDGPLALVVGNEGEGLRALVRKTCDYLVRLPMVGHVESLNASVAGSVMLYMAFQARQPKA